jgi:hypothetical protein
VQPDSTGQRILTIVPRKLKRGRRSEEEGTRDKIGEMEEKDTLTLSMSKSVPNVLLNQKCDNLKIGA